MKIDLTPSKHVLAILAENYDKLAKAGVKINISLESDDFLSIKRKKDNITVKLNPKNKELVDALDELAPLAITLVTVENEEYTEAKAKFFRDLQVVKVKCPFCGYEDEYAIVIEPVTYSHPCRGCRAVVGLEVGDISNIVEEALYVFKDDVMPNNIEVNNYENKILKIVDKKHGDEMRAVRIDEFNGGRLATWLLFFQEPIKITNNELIPLVKDKTLYLGKKFIYEGKERRDYVIKKVRRAGGSSRAGLIGVPQKWIGKEAVVLVKNKEENKTSTKV